MPMIGEDTYLADRKKQEEERKRREEEARKRLAAQQAARAQSPVFKKPQEAPAKQQVLDPKKTPHTEVARFAADYGGAPKGSSALADYFKMAKEMGGADKVNDRIKQATSIWRRYYKPYGGADIVWALARSPYTFEEMEKMGQAGKAVLFNYDGSAKKNYLPPTSATGDKGIDFARAIVGAGFGVKVKPKEKPAYELNPYGYGAEGLGDIFPASADRVKSSAEYQYDLAYAKQQETWDQEFASANSGLVSSLEDITGVRREDFTTWQEWDGRVQEARNNLRGWDVAAYEQAYMEFVSARSKWKDEHHGAEQDSHMYRGVARAALATAETSMYFVVGGGIASWGAIGILGKGFTALGTLGIGSQVAMAHGEDPNVASAALTERLHQDYIANQAKSEGQRLADYEKALVMDASEAGNREAIKKLQLEFQQPVEVDGVEVRPALGKGLIADGVLTGDWMSVIEQASDMRQEKTVELQMMMIAGGYIGKDAEITGAFEKYDETSKKWVEDTEWVEAYDRMQADWASQQKMMVDHPKLFAFLNAWGMPMSAEGVYAIGRKLTNEGVPHAPLKAIAQAGYYLGGLQNAIPALLEVNLKMDKDPVMKAKRVDLLKIVRGQLPPDDETIPFDIGPDISEEQAQFLVESGYVTDPDAKRIVLEMATRESEILLEPTSGWVGYLAYQTQEEADARKWLAEHRDVVHAVNMATMIIGQTILTKAARGTNHTYTRTVEAVNKGKFQKELSRITKMANDGEFLGNAHEYVGGSEAKVFLDRIGDYRYGKDIYTKDSEAVQASSAQVVHVLEQELPAPQKAKQIAEALGLKYADENVKAWVDNLVKLGDDYKTKVEKAVATKTEKLEKRREAARERASVRYEKATYERLGKIDKAEEAARVKLVEQRAQAAKNIESRIRLRVSKDAADMTYRAPGPGIRMVSKSEYIPLAVEAQLNKRFAGREQKLADTYAQKRAELKAQRDAEKTDWLSHNAESWERRRQKRLKQREGTNALQNVVAERIMYRQQGRGDVYAHRDVTDFVQQLAKDMWSGADGHYYDIFPHFALNRTISQKSQSRIAIEQTLARIPSERARTMLSAVVLQFYHAPLKSFSTELTDFPHRVADYVAVVTNDMAQVARWRTKAAMTDFNQPRSKERFIAELSALKDDYILTGHVSRRQRKLLEDPQRTPEITGADDQLTGLKMSGEAGTGAEFVGRYLDENGKPHEVVMMTSQQSHEVPLGKDVMWARRKTKDGANAFEVGYIHGLNIANDIEAALNRPSTFLRVVSVGSGGVILFGKHVLNDSARTLSMEGVKALNIPGNRKGFYERIGKCEDLNVSDYVLFERKVAINSEQHYNLEGGLQVTRVPIKAFDQKGRAKNMQGAVENVRRIIMDDGFRAYAQGGAEGMLRWLDSDAGRLALERAGAVGGAKAFLREEGREMVSGEELHKIEVQWYAAEKMKMFDDYAQLPRLSQSLLDMASGKRPRHEKSIREAITEAYRHGENPTVDVAIETGNPITNFFAKMTKAAMTPNRLNREAVFDKVFNEVFDRLTKKEGLTGNDAARIAATVARGRTMKVHFDLSTAMRFELKHRWFAWFGTKHRLWNTWLAKTAAFYPGYAGAVHEFLNWMEDRNSDESIPEWEKHNIRFSIAGREVSINMGPWTWMMDMAIESPFGHMAEEAGALTVNLVTGSDLKPSPNPFPNSFARPQAIFQTMWRTMKAPLRDGTPDDWKKFIEDLPEDEREEFVEQALTIYHMTDEEDFSLMDACKSVLVSNVGYEAARFFKPASTRILGEQDMRMARYQRDFDSLGDNYLARREYLNLHPDYAATLGVGELDPWEQEELTQAKAEYFRLRREYSNEITRAFRQGRLGDPAYEDQLYVTLEDKIKDLRNGSQVFANWLDASGEGDMTFEQKAHLILPAVPESHWEDSKLPDEKAKNDYVSQQLRPAYEAACKAENLDPESTSIRAQYLRRKFINEPLSEFMQELPGDLSTAVKNNAQLIAEYNDSGGLFRSTQYVEMILSNQRRDFWLAGLSEGKGDPYNPLFAKRSTIDKEYNGWRSTEEVDEMWGHYTYRYAQLEAYASTHDLNMKQKQMVEMKEALIREVEEQWCPANPLFELEWRFSNVRTYERMRMLNYGEGKTRADDGWDELLQITEDYWYELDHTVDGKKVGIGRQHKMAADINRKYLAKIVALMGQNEDWYWQWKVLSPGITLTKLGFNYHWRLEDKSDWILWKDENPVDEAEYVDYTEE